MDFPNGIDSYLHTFYEISTAIAALRITPIKQWSEEMQNVQDSGGSMAFFDLAKSWSIEFELLHKDRFWDGEFFDEIEDFVNGKLE